MGYFLISAAATAVSAISHASPKTHTPLPRLSNLGHRFYSTELSRWISRDPIGELAFTRVMSLMRRAMLTEIGPRHLMSGNPFTFNISILNDYAFVGNDGVNHEDLLGLTPVQRHPTTGVVYCNDKCEMVIKNCETWGAAEPCCKEHEQVHIDQFKKAGLWCKKVDGCCVGGGRTGNTGDLDPTRDQKKVQEEAECPAHKASLECCTKGMNKPGITEQEYWDYRDCAFRSYWQRKGYKCPGNENDGELPPPRTF